MPRTKLVNGVEVPFTPEEEAARDAEELEWQTNELPKIQNQERYRAAKRAALASLDEEELDVLVEAYNEVKRYRIDSNADTPIIDGMMTVFQGQTKPQIGLRIESRVQNYLVNAGIALAEKIRDE